MMEDKDPYNPLDDLDSIFENQDDFQVTDQSANVLVISDDNTYNRLENALESHQEFNLSHVDNLDDAVVRLLQELFAVIIIDQDQEGIDSVSVSRVVRINHPMAQIVVVSKKRGSQLIANIVNQGSVDAFLTYPLKSDYVLKLVTAQVAEHEITKMLTSFVSQPPKLSKASYLLLDPSLSFADESKPVKFVGIMVVHKSVPRYTRFFEELLAKDEILFAGYLSGVAMLGRELFANKDPLKEINFGGVSVIFRFHEDIQISVFVRNLTRHNVEFAETRIGEIVDKLLVENESDITQFEPMSDEAYDNIAKIASELAEANDNVNIPSMEKSIDQSLLLLLYGSDKDVQERFKTYIARNKSITSQSFTVKQNAIDYLSQNPVGAILLDSQLETDIDPLEFAEHAKEIIPYVQVIFRARDRRTSSTLIEALNSGYINYIIPYRLTSKDTAEYVTRAFLKATELKNQSESGQGLNSALDQATIAKTMILKNMDSYKPENPPELHGVFIFHEIKPVYQITWEHMGSIVEFDDEMMAGLVSSLNSVGGEMFNEQGSLGALELGGANIIVRHHGELKVAYILKHIDPNTSVVIEKEISKCSNNVFEIIDETDVDNYESMEVKSNLDKITNELLMTFSSIFG